MLCWYELHWENREQFTNQLLRNEISAVEKDAAPILLSFVSNIKSNEFLFPTLTIPNRSWAIDFNVHFKTRIQGYSTRPGCCLQRLKTFLHLKNMHSKSSNEKKLKKCFSLSNVRMLLVPLSFVLILIINLHKQHCKKCNCVPMKNFQILWDSLKSCQFLFVCKLKLRDSNKMLLRLVASLDRIIVT